MNENLIKIEHPRFTTAMMYADTTHNMTGRPVYAEIGFGNEAFVHRDLWAKLETLVPELEAAGRKVKIFDAYRPPLAHTKLHEVIPQPGFFAANAAASPHCRGTAVDLCLTDENGQELCYPTLVDAYDPVYAAKVQSGDCAAFLAYLHKARHDYTGGSMEERRNRDELRCLMEKAGLKALTHEWWHYELPEGRDEHKYPLIDWP